MSATQKVSAALAEHGIRDFDLVWVTSTNGKPHDFTLTVRRQTFRGSCVRAVLRAFRRQFADASRTKRDNSVTVCVTL